MKRLPHVAMMLVAVSLLAADKTVKEKSDFEKIQGKWIVVELYAGGEKEKLSKEDKNETITFTLSGKKLTSSTNGDKSAVELRPDKRPRELDRTNGRGEVTPAIYELSGRHAEVLCESQ